MGLSIDRSTFTDEEYAVSGVRLRENLLAMQLLLQRPGFGNGEHSVGAEVEMCIVDDAAQALRVNREIMDASGDPQLQLELDRFNLEYNLSPVAAAGKPFSTMQAELESALRSINEQASVHNGRIIMIGILPTLTMRQLMDGAMTDLPRYWALEKGIRRIRGEDLRIRIDGEEPLDETCRHVTIEGANTSFQIHLRINPDDFAKTFNAAQFVTPLALAVGANSPFLMGHKLWQETRISLFKQSVDTRGASDHEWRRAARVPFGHGWVRQGPYELFAESCLLYPSLMPVCSEEDPLQVVRDGGVPELAELRLQQGTIWNWNRAVYDAADGGHFRIEFRALPAGPSAIDMMANAAFIIGLTIGFRERIDSLIPALPFRYAEYNFYRAAQFGLDAELLWPDLEQASPRVVSVRKLCLDSLPIADEGLAKLNVDETERKKLLGNIRNRLESGLTPASWQRLTLDKYSGLNRSDGLAAMVQDYLAQSASGRTFIDWS